MEKDNQEKRSTNMYSLTYFKVLKDKSNIDFNESIAAKCEPSKDSVWCKQGDSCGENDRMCSSLCPKSSCRHDGCCTGLWDWGGDGASISVIESFGPTDIITNEIIENSNSIADNDCIKVTKDYNTKY